MLNISKDSVKYIIKLALSMKISQIVYTARILISYMNLGLPIGSIKTIPSLRHRVKTTHRRL